MGWLSVFVVGASIKKGACAHVEIFPCVQQNLVHQKLGQSQAVDGGTARARPKRGKIFLRSPRFRTVN